MKKVLFFILFAFSLTAFAQVQIPTEYTIQKPLRLETVNAGSLADSVLVRGVDKIIKFAPRSQFSGGNLQSTFDKGRVWMANASDPLTSYFSIESPLDSAAFVWHGQATNLAIAPTGFNIAAGYNQTVTAPTQKSIMIAALPPTTNGTLKYNFPNNKAYNKSEFFGEYDVATTDDVTKYAEKTQYRNPIYFKGKDIHWFGDSYTIGSGASPVGNRFSTLVSKALGATEINHGVAGTTIQKRVPINYMAGPNMVDNVANIPTKIATKAMLVFAYGLNDMGQTATAYTTENYKADYQTVLNNAFSKGWLPDQILIIPAYYIGTAGYAAYATITGNAAPTQARHLSFIKAAKEIAETNGTMYFDIYQDQLKNNITLLSADNIHPNNAGYEYIANDIINYLGGVSSSVSITTDTGYSTGSGYIGKINGALIDNSFMYQNTQGVGIATISPKASLQVHSITAVSSIVMSNTTTTDANNRGTRINQNGLDFNIINKEAGNVTIETGNSPRFTMFKTTGNITLHNGGTPADSGYRLAINGTLRMDGVINLKAYTVSTLPTGLKGDCAYVTDALTPTYNGVLTGGGTEAIPVFYNGSNWVSH